jgi:hypothetical protein
VGIDEKGMPIRPLSVDEQEAFVRAILRAAELVTAAAPDDRGKADLFHQLGVLRGIHGQQLPAVGLRDALPEITVIMHPDTQESGGYTLNVSALHARQPFDGTTHADLILQFSDRPGQDLRGRLEDAPDGTVTINPEHPPSWLH